VFDATKGPCAVFARFFGTDNPYEALEGGRAGPGLARRISV
jgi:hypothetical protein